MTRFDLRFDLIFFVIRFEKKDLIPTSQMLAYRHKMKCINHLNISASDAV